MKVGTWHSSPAEALIARAFFKAVPDVDVWATFGNVEFAKSTGRYYYEVHFLELRRNSWPQLGLFHAD